MIALIVLALFAGLTFGTLRLATDAATRQVHERVQTNAAIGVTYVEEAIGAIVDLAHAFSVDPELLDAVGDGTLRPTSTRRANANSLTDADGPPGTRPDGI